MSARKVDYDKFQKLNVQILGIAVTNPFSQKTFADSLKLPYPLLADYPDPEVTRSYGVLMLYPKDPKRMVARRSFFLIDKQRIVRGRWLPDVKDVFPSEPILTRVWEMTGKP